MISYFKTLKLFKKSHQTFRSFSKFIQNEDYFSSPSPNQHKPNLSVSNSPKPQPRKTQQNNLGFSLKKRNDKITKKSDGGFEDNESVNNKHGNYFANEPREKTEILDFSDTGILNIFQKNEKEKIPTLNSTLEPIIAHKGIYQLSEMAGKMSPKEHAHLAHILQPDQIDFEQIGAYTHSSQDTKLLSFAKSLNCKLITSTSACSSFLSHVHFFISTFSEPNLTFLYNFYGFDRVKYMNAQKKPYSHCLRLVDKENGIWGLDSFPSIFEPHHKILMDMGKILERVYTMEPDHFQALFNKNKLNLADYPELETDYHRYMVMNKTIALRSQIDCRSSIGGEDIIFEIKTRAVAPVRYDVANYQDYLDYPLSQLCGSLCSYEREFYDLVRGGLLKYYFQLKIGDMNGAFVGYHNTVKNFGFEYIKMSSIEKVIFGSTHKADTSFAISTKIMSEVIKRTIEILKDEKFEFLNLSVYADANDSKLTLMIELVDYIDYESFRNLELKKVEGMSSIFDFYKKTPGKDKIRVFKLDVLLYARLNGVYNPVFMHDLQESDLLEFEYVLQPAGFISFEEYMQFMLHSSKYENLIIEQKYLGYWANTFFNYTIN